MRRRGRVAPGKERVERRNHERETINSRDRRDLNERKIRRSRVPEQVPGEADLRKMCADKFERNPYKWRANTGKNDAPPREAIHDPAKTPDENAPSGGDEKQHAPATGSRETSMHRKNSGNPGNGSKHKQQSMKKTATKRHPRARSKKNNEKDANANPRIDAEMRPDEGERQCRTGDATDADTQSGRQFRSGLRTKIIQPTALRHQCFTMALKPARSWPFFAGSAAF